MHINPSLHNFLESIIFDFQITIDRVHPVQNLLRLLHHYSHNVKNTKNAEK